MSEPYIEKKAAEADWHPADIVAAVRKAGSTLRQLSLAHGYSPWTIKGCLSRQYPGAEQIVADFIGVHPKEIWPTRYQADGTPARKPSRRGGRRRKDKSTSAPGTRHVNVGVAS